MIVDSDGVRQTYRRPDFCLREIVKRERHQHNLIFNHEKACRPLMNKFPRLDLREN